jgi:hypothetical protein
MPGFERAELAARADAEQLLALGRVLVREAERIGIVVLGAGELLARRVRERELRAQARRFEARDRLVEKAMRAQAVVLEERDRGEIEQRARDDLALADLATELERRLELGSRRFVLVLAEQRATELEVFEALVRTIAERDVDRERFLGGLLRGLELAEVVEEPRVRADDRRIRRRRAALLRDIERTLEIRARGRRVLDLAIEQRDVALGDLELVAGLLAQRDRFERHVERLGEIAAIAIDRREIRQRLRGAVRIERRAVEAECALLMLERAVEMAATALDDAEVRLGERGLDAIAARARDARELERERFAARVVALRERDLDTLGERVREHVGVVAPRRDLGGALPLAVGRAESADRREEVAGDDDGPAVGRGPADRVDDRERSRRLQRIGQRLREMQRRGRGKRARIFGARIPGFCGAHGRAEHGRGDERRCGQERPRGSVKPVFRSPWS